MRLQLSIANLDSGKVLGSQDDLPNFGSLTTSQDTESRSEDEPERGYPL